MPRLLQVRRKLFLRAAVISLFCSAACAEPTGKIFLNGFGDADGVAQPDYSSHGLTATTVYYASDLGFSCPCDDETALPNDAAINAAAALCTTNYCLLDIEHYHLDDANEALYGSRTKMRSLLTKFKTAIGSKQLGCYNCGLNGYSAISYIQASSATFQTNNETSAEVADLVDFYAPQFYDDDGAPGLTYQDDWDKVAEALNDEITRIGIPDKPIIPWVWGHTANYNTAAWGTISGITKASPAVVTVDDANDVTNIVDGQIVFIASVGGMTQVNNTMFLVDKLTTTTFGLYNSVTGAAVDSSAYSNYTSGGDFGRMTTMSNWEKALDASITRLDGFILWAQSQARPNNFTPTSEPYFLLMKKKISEANASRSGATRSAASSRDTASARTTRLQ